MCKKWLIFKIIIIIIIFFDFRGQQDTKVDSLEFSPLRAARSTPNLRKGKSTSRGRINHTTRQRAESSLCLAQRDTSIPIRYTIHLVYLVQFFPFLAHWYDLSNHLNVREFTSGRSTKSHARLICQKVGCVFFKNCQNKNFYFKIKRQAKIVKM